MKKLIKIQKHEIESKEYQGQRIVTFRDIDTVHERPEGTARKRFNDNKHRLDEGVDYFVRKTDEAKKEFGIAAPNGLVLITESGYLMIVKSFTDNLAWEVQRALVNSYFKKKSPEAKPDHKAKEIDAKYKNSLVRMSNQFLKIASYTESLKMKEVCIVYAANTLAGKEITLLPEAIDKYYTAGDIAKEVGLSSNKIGRIANERGLKTPEYGKEFHDKSAHSNKEVTSWRYNEAGKLKLLEICRA